MTAITHHSQELVGAIPSGFKSPLPHQLLTADLITSALVGLIAFSTFSRLRRQQRGTTRRARTLLGRSLALTLFLTLDVMPPAAEGQTLNLPTVAFAAGAAADWVTTYRNLKTPATISADGLMRTEFYEANPMIGWAEDRPALMFTVAAGLDVAGVYAWHRLTERHRKIRAIGLYAAAAGRFALAYRNHRTRERHLGRP